MWRAVVVVALVGCGGDALVDRPAGEIADMCAMHPLVAPYSACRSGFGGCDPYPSQCGFAVTSFTCETLIKSLPATCAATPTDYLMCQQGATSCEDAFGDACAAFTACGVKIWSVACSSCG